MRQPTPSALHSLVAAVPAEALRALVLELLRNGAVPAADATAPVRKRRRGWPLGKPRGRRAGRRDLPPKARAAQAIAVHPEKTNRVIAEEIGVSVQTVMRARHQMKNGGAARSNRRGKPRRGPGRPPAARRGAADPKLAARRKREAERQRAKKAAVKQAEASGKPGNGAAATVDPNRPPEITAAKLWKHAARLSPKDPPRSIVAEFGIGEAQAREAFSKATLPPGLNSTAIERFLDVRAAT